jgi:hypothetical protein
VNSQRRLDLAGALVLLALIVASLAPFVLGDRTLQDSAVEPSLYASGGLPVEAGSPGIPRELDPGAPAWQTEAWFPLEHAIVFGEHALPIWNPYEAYGVPLAANMQSQPYSPFAWIAIVRNSPRMYALFVLARLYAAGLFAFLFLRRFVGLRAALAGGAAYMYSGYFWLYLTMPELSVAVLVPALLLGVELVVRNRSAGAVAFTAVAAGCSVLGGMPETALLALSFAALYALTRLAFAPRTGNVARALVALGCAYALGAGIGAIVILPLAEYVPLSLNQHAGIAIGLRADGFSWSIAGTYLAPLALGPPYNAIFTNFAGWTGIRGFFGTSVTFFALVAVASELEALLRRRSRAGEPVLFFATVATVLLAKRFGAGVVQWIGVVPGFRFVNFPKYEEAVIEVCVALLAGFGVARLARGKSSPLALAAAAAVPLTALEIFTWSQQSLLPAAGDHRFLYVHGLRDALGALALALVVAAVRYRGAVPAFAGWAPLAIVVLELHAGYIVPLFYRLVSEPPRAASPLPGAPYVAMLQRATARGAERVIGEDDVLYPNWNDPFGLFGVEALDAFYPERFLPFVRAFLPVGAAGPGDELTDRFVGAPGERFATALQQRFLQLSSIRFIVSQGPVGPPKAPFPSAFSAPGVRVSVFASPLPRLALYARVRPVADGAEGLRVLQSVRFNPSREAVVEGSEPAVRALAGAASAAVRAGSIVSYRSDDVRAATDAAAPALAVLSDTFFPGWTATIDGRTVPIVRANVLFRGVLVPAGRHALEFRYRPRSAALGSAIASVSLAIVALLAAFGALRRRAGIVTRYRAP